MIAWDEEFDVVVIGSGLAGLSAALEARKAGASVIVLEKMKISGGNTRISDGGLAAPGNYLQKKLGVEDSAQRFYDDMLQAGLGLSHPELLRIVAEKSSEVIEWTRSELGVRYLERLDRFGGHSVARCLTTRSHSGNDIIKALESRLRALEVEIRTCCLLSQLITDPNGEVSGVQIQSDYRFPHKDSGSTKYIRAVRAVVLATGGFGSDIDFRKLQNPRLDRSIGTTNHRGATAEGLVAALKINAAPIHLSWIQTGPWGCADERGYGKGSRFASYSVYSTGILVDPATGRRIVNEWADRRTRSDAIIATGRICVGIVDAEGAKKDLQSLTHCVKNGKVQPFDDLQQLAVAYGMPPDALKATVDDYNQRIIENRADPLGKPLDQGVRPLSHPPFYAIRLWPKVHYTPGGVGINSKAEVISLQNRPIPRLFAAGEVCGGIHGASRLGNCALTECLVFGRIAGRQAAALSPQRE
jgi:flavocytochrome c